MVWYANRPLITAWCDLRASPNHASEPSWWSALPSLQSGVFHAAWSVPASRTRLPSYVKSQYGTASVLATDCSESSNSEVSAACCVRKPMPSCMWSDTRPPAPRRCTRAKWSSGRKSMPYLAWPSAWPTSIIACIPSRKASRSVLCSERSARRTYRHEKVRFVNVCECTEPSGRRASTARCASYGPIASKTAIALTVPLFASDESTPCLTPSGRLRRCHDGSSSRSR